MPASTGRFAPSPTGDLHLGNLRTALVAWLSARAGVGRFLVRMEDLDRVTSSREHEQRQLSDLSAFGTVWDGEVVRQSDRFARYEAAIERLRVDGRVYECFCSRREIREAASAPHGELPDGRYPGTCRDLSDAQRRARRSEGRPAALRLRAEGEQVEFVDRVHGRVIGTVDDVVLRRNDGVPAYNLAVVVDDAAQGVTEVVRGDDLLGSTPGQIRIAELLGLPVPTMLHVPLVLAPDRSRLAKRHGAVTLRRLTELGVDAVTVRSWLAVSLGLAETGEQPDLEALVARFAIERLPREPWVLTASEAAGHGSIGS